MPVRSLIFRVALVSVLLGGALAALGTPASAAVDYGDPAQLAIETDAVIDRMSGPPLNIGLRPWTREILPWFSVEGIVDLPRTPARVRYVDFDGAEATHVLGTTDCMRGVVSLNARYANPVSSMYRSVDIVFTLTHELAHVEQYKVCARAPAGNVEASAQLMAFEVDAAMALNGNVWAGRALLGELRTIAVGVLQYDALQGVSGAQEKLDAVRSQIYSPTEQADRAQLARSWADDPAGRKEALLRYDVRPYEKLTLALAGDGWINGLAMPMRGARVWERTPTNGTLRVDDLAVFLDEAPRLYP